jgi:hypothetical protein
MSDDNRLDIPVIAELGKLAAFTNHQPDGGFCTNDQ